MCGMLHVSAVIQPVYFSPPSGLPSEEAVCGYLSSFASCLALGGL